MNRLDQQVWICDVQYGITMDGGGESNFSLGGIADFFNPTTPNGELGLTAGVSPGIAATEADTGYYGPQTQAISQDIGTTAAGIFGGPLGAGAARAGYTLVDGGTPGDAIKSGVVTGLTGAAVSGATGALSAGPSAAGSSLGTDAGASTGVGGELSGDTLDLPSTISSAPAPGGINIGGGYSSEPTLSPADITSTAGGGDPGLSSAVTGIGSNVGGGRFTGANTPPSKPAIPDGSSGASPGIEGVQPLSVPSTTAPAGSAPSIGPAGPSGSLSPTDNLDLSGTSAAPTDGAAPRFFGADTPPPKPSESSGLDLGGVFKGIKDNANFIVPAAGIAYEALTGVPKNPNEQTLTNSANQLSTQGEALSAYLTNGTLPPGMDNALKTASASAKASIKSRYAQMGLSGSTMEQEALAAVDSQAVTQALTMAQSLNQTGLTETGMANQLYQSIMNTQLQADANLQNAIGRFAVAAAGGGAVR